MVVLDNPLGLKSEESFTKIKHSNKCASEQTVKLY